jgi:two-component system, cell cycle sensor histidine kinase and response regulator CckA
VSNSTLQRQGFIQDLEFDMVRRDGSTFPVLLNSTASVPEPLVEDLEQIRLAGERAAGLTRQLLAFSRRQVLDPQPVDINRVVVDVERMVSRIIGEHIELRLVLGDDIGLVHADRVQLEQVVLNLVLNARDAMPTGGRLTLETRDVQLDDEYAQVHAGVTPGPYVLLVVSDTGVGMDADTRARIFEPFFTTKPAGSGTGLGLATVYGIVKQSGGHVWVYSEPNRGTSFKIYLPLLAGDMAAAAAPAPSEPAELTGYETILLVEDEDVVRRAARSILERRGYTILETRSAGEALARLESHAGPIHLLLTDVIMPQINGRELAARVAAMHPDMRVLFMSGYTDDTVVQHGVLDQTAHHIDKPLTPDALARKVRQILDAPE